MKPRFLLVCYVALWTSSFAIAQDASPPTKKGEMIEQLAAAIDSVESIVSNLWVIEWLKQVKNLPSVEPRTVESNGKQIVIDEATFYYSRYGSPLSYARVLDLAVTAGFEGNEGARIFDFGYGSIGHLRMLALSGQHVVGVDVAPFLKLMYRDASGPLGSGSVQVFDGKFPADQDLAQIVGGAFDLVLSKNVLKRGYIHPSREVPDKRMVIDLGVDDPSFLAHVSSMLKPSGLFVIYNFCPPKAAADQDYIPWAEGESPFTREAFVDAGFEVVHFDVVDDAEARRLGQALGWDASMDLEKDLFAWYTIVRKNDSNAEIK
jgi:SAM-dependent methyltransferase